ncbi:MAG: DNA internalization-related competence protein ComEC/Rec2 [Deltaproteobacteria bacterium]|nr:DNA internalization-related competence protein ComEC/Rec2 [Deltaproteobacteria bacterium]
MPPPSETFSRPLIPLLLSYMSGLTVGLYLPGVSYTGYLLAALFFGNLYFLWKKRPLRLLPLLLFIGLGYLAIQPWVEPSFPSNHISNHIDTKPWHIKGTIIEAPRISDGRTGLVVEVETLSRAEQRYQVCGRLRLTVRGIVSDVYQGNTVAFLGRLKAPRNFNNPNGFNYKRYLAFRGIRVTSYLNDPTFFVRIRGKEAPVVLKMLQGTRKAGSELIPAATRDKSAQGILKALLLGDRSGISSDLREHFNRTGLGHLLAISGLHIGMVAAFFFFLFRILLSRSERLLLAGTVSKWGAGLTILPVLFYGLLVGMSPSTQRAVIMALVFLIAIILEKEHHPINTLAVAAFIILLIAPTSLFDISFQLSFIAVFSILCGLRSLPWKVAPSDSRSSLLLKKLGTFVAVSFFAIMGTLPLVLYYFNQVSLVGLLSNCIAVPIVGFLVLPIGMLAMLVLPASFYLAVWIMKSGGMLVSILLGAVSFFSNWSFAAIKTVTPTLFEIVLFYALAATLLNLKRKHLRTIAIPLLLVIISADALYWMGERFWHRDLRVTAIDVGQGNAALLELPKGTCILIDGGGFFDNSFDVGRSVVAPFLWQKKIATIDYIVLSHPQADHLNGLLYIARNFNVREVWSNGEPGYTETYRTLLNILSEEDIPTVRLNRDSKPRIINGVRLNVLHPPADFLSHAGSNPNNNSLVVKAVFGETAFLFPGDIEADAERELVARAGNELKSSILLAPHHGSRTSSTPVFLDRVQPDIVIFSSRSSSRFRHPHAEVLKRYKTRNCKTFRTDQDGAIMIATDGKEVRIKKYLPGIR